MPNYVVTPISSQTGIQRDGTEYDSLSYINGQWTRFYKGKPRKMGGYRSVDLGDEEIPKNMFSVDKNKSIDLYIGRPSSIKFINLDYNGNGDVEFDRTPTTGFTANTQNIWDFDLFTQDVGIVGGGAVSFVVTQVAPNGDDIGGTNEGPIFYGDINSNSPLTQVMSAPTGGTPVLVSGGVVFCSPVLVAYGNDGIIRWSAEGDITNWPDNYLIVSNTKIVKAFRTRGQSPTILLWSLNSLCRATYTSDPQNPTQNTFIPDVVEDNISVLSSDCIVQYDQQFYWVGTDQFYFFNGIVNKLNNTMNNDWFFQNINLQHRSKVWGMVVRRYSEIWWFYPRGESTECNAAIIYNVQEGIWYDTVINRSCGVAASTFPFPIMADNQLTRTPTSHGYIYTYPIWMHEYGTDKIINSSETAIDSYIQTKIIDLWSENPQNTRLLRNRRIAVDFVQVGNMTLTISNQMYPRSVPELDGPHTFSPDTPYVDFSSQGALVSFIFRSNEGGGYYQGGKTLYFSDTGDVLK